MSTAELNFRWVRALLVDGDAQSVKLLSRMLEGYGLANRRTVETAEEALASLESDPPDIIFCEAQLSGLTSADFIRTIRKSESKTLRVTPIFVFTGYTQRSMVEAARDAGANLVLKKPVSATVLYDRLSWVARGTRAFVETGSYTGPDPRFKNAGLPDGVGRRSTDLGGDVGEQTESNMSQDEIDSLIKPMKIDL